MYQSVCLISEERNECVIATEVSAGLTFPSSLSPSAIQEWESSLVTFKPRGPLLKGGSEPLLGRPGSGALGALLALLLQRM